MNQKILLTPAEVAEVLSVSRSVVYDLIAAKEFRSIKVGRSRRVLRTSLDEYVRRMEKSEPLTNGGRSTST
jgi:excisionase family DNA binding protein